MASRHAEILRTAAREARYSPLGQRAGAPARQRRLIIPSSLGLPALPDIQRKESSAASALAEAVKAEAAVEAAATTAEAAAAAAEARLQTSEKQRDTALAYLVEQQPLQQKAAQAEAKAEAEVAAAQAKAAEAEQV